MWVWGVGWGINGDVLFQVGVEWGGGIWVFFITSLFMLGVCVCVLGEGEVLMVVCLPNWV